MSNDNHDLDERVDQFRLMELPGQPMCIIMGTHRLVQDLHAELKRVRARVSKLELEEEGAKEAFAVVADSNKLLRAQVFRMESALNLMRHELERARHAEANKAGDVQ
jgi:hypothetical protein